VSGGAGIYGPNTRETSYVNKMWAYVLPFVYHTHSQGEGSMSEVSSETDS
jgi:hypothetical protein